MRRRRYVQALGLLAAGVLLAGCTGESGNSAAPGGSSSAPSTTAPSSSAPSTTAPVPTAGGSPPAATPSPSSSPSDSPSPSASAGPPFRATTGADTAAPEGGLLTVTEMRVAPQDGYERVVLELAGADDGVPGWDVRYTDDPREQGSGARVAVKGKGKGVLAVTVTGVGYPFDTGEREVQRAPELPDGLQVVRALALGFTFEGQYEAWIGTSDRVPFRVFRLADPARIVIDFQLP